MGSHKVSQMIKEIKQMGKEPLTVGDVHIVEYPGRGKHLRPNETQARFKSQLKNKK